MGDFQEVFSCTIGGIAFQLNSYTKKADGVFDSVGKRVGTKVTFNGRGDIQAADATALASDLAAFAASAVDGANFSVTAHGVLKEQLLLADCLPNFPPHVTFAYGDDQGDNFQALTFTVEATVKPSSADDSGILSETETLRCAVNAESLSTTTTSGEVRTTAAVSAMSVVLTGAGTPPVPKIPLRPAGWGQTYSYQRDASDALCTYEVTQTQLVEDYPTALSGAILDGERTMTTAYDGQNRAVTTWSYDYTGSGAESFVNAKQAELRAAGGLLQASMAVTCHKTQHATAQFQVLAGRDGNVLEFGETVSYSGTGPMLEELRYPGLAPLLVQSSQSAYAVEQSGKAIGLASYPRPPDPLFPAANYQEYPQTAYNRANPNEWETSWRYKFILLVAPASPTFPSASSPGLYGGGPL